MTGAADGVRDGDGPPNGPNGPKGPDGVLLIDKPSGITSHDAVARVRRALSTRKVGHAGTLDPMATGLLVIGVGRATRLLRFLGDLPKTYVGEGLLGVETDTLDADGTVVRRGDAHIVAAVALSDLRKAMAELTGQIEQVPPAYSAVQVGGERLYRAARRGEVLLAPARIVRVDAFELTTFEPPRFGFQVRCSGGTYVRSLVADVGTQLGCGAHLIALRRTAIGPFAVEDARPPEDPGEPLPIERAVSHLPSLRVDAEEARVARHGSILGPAGLEGPYRVHAPDGGFIGVYRDDGTKAVPEVIVA
jgi:tRNA pseudouridine55 synthase